MRFLTPLICFAAGVMAGNLDLVLPKATAQILPLAETLSDAVHGFTENHPQDKKKAISYVPLEGGDENTYWRGSIALQYGKVRVEHPRHFSLVTGESGLSMLLTPTAACKNPVTVGKLTIDYFELTQHEAKDSCEVYFMVMGVRKGHEKYEAVHARGARR
jgi:hypothetical protein